MALPPRVYYTLQEVTARWGCNIADVAGWAAAGKFHIMTGIGLVRCGEEIVAGRVVLSPMDLMPLFRRCGTGPSFNLSARRERNTKTVPVNGSLRSTDDTSAAKPSWPFLKSTGCVETRTRTRLEGNIMTAIRSPA